MGIWLEAVAPLSRITPVPESGVHHLLYSVQQGIHCEMACESTNCPVMCLSILVLTLGQSATRL